MSQKEIDFLPQWYRSSRRQQVSYQTQYVALGGVLVVMMVWNFVAARSISKAQAQFAQMETRQAEAQSVSAKLTELKSELRELLKKAESIEKIDSKIDVASVLAEMSFLIDEKIVLSKVEFVAEKFADEQKAQPFSGADTVVGADRTKSGQEQELPLGDVRFKVVISGLAANGSDVTALICQLEDSPYFCQVVPSFFSRPAEIRAKSDLSLRSRTGLVGKTPNAEWGVPEDGGEIEISEFEISCYLANYREL
ncbi:MAG: PilN domain-containing protein [Planctomycetota bacterium]|jgi:hypothetical protein